MESLPPGFWRQEHWSMTRWRVAGRSNELASPQLIEPVDYFLHFESTESHATFALIPNRLPTYFPILFLAMQFDLPVLFGHSIVNIEEII